MDITLVRFLKYFGAERSAPTFVTLRGVDYVVKYSERLPEGFLALRSEYLNRVLFYTSLGSNRFHIAVERFGVDLGQWRDDHASQLLARNEETRRQAYSFIRQAAKGLKYLHQHNIAHVDIKPGNILVSGHRAILCDFGCSVRLTGPSTGIYAGTTPYLAPERIAGVTWLQSDLWALGITLYQIFTTVSPFHGLHNDFELEEDVDRHYRHHRGRDREIIAMIVTRSFARDHKLLDYKNVRRLYQQWLSEDPSKRKNILRSRKNAH